MLSAQSYAKAYAKTQSTTKWSICNPNRVNSTSIPEKEWVRKLQLEKAEKIIVIAPTATDPETSHYVLHNPSDYSKGLIFTGHSFYEGEINSEHMAQGRGLERFLL